MSAVPEAIGVFGGSFDPVHSGHLAIADEARRLLGLTRMLLMPAAVPPHKPQGLLSTAEQREAMLQLALCDRQGLELSRIELEERRVCYTIDTLSGMRDGRPPTRPVFLLGMDSLLHISTWRRWRELISEFDLAVIDRTAGYHDSGDEPEAEVTSRIVTLTEDRTPRDVGAGGRIFHLPTAPIAVSSSTIRARARVGDDLTGLVPPAVARYIQDMGLYRQEERC